MMIVQHNLIDVMVIRYLTIHFYLYFGIDVSVEQKFFFHITINCVLYVRCVFVA